MSANPEVHETIGNYLIERSLAHGSMGHVYLARHTLTHAQVALKVLRADLNVDTQAEERFLREVRAAARIGHDGIVKVHDAGRSSDGRLYLAMELLSGETLEERVARTRGDRLTAMDWLLRVLEPLEAAHAQDIVHRDLKPANVFIARSHDGSERVKLLDFGLARDTREKSGTQTGIAMGTPYYMSPEQATRPKDVGPASDVWSIGVMMYEVLSNHMPFEGETLHSIVIQSSTEPHVPLGLREPLLDDALCTLVDDCLTKDQVLRPANAALLAARLRPLLEDDKVRAALAPAVPQGNGAGDGNAVDCAAGEPEQEQQVLRIGAMPFADTAISLTPRLLESDVRPAPRRSTRGLWISALAALAIATAGFLWALGRAEDQGVGNEVPPTAPNRAAAQPGALAPPPAELATPRPANQPPSKPEPANPAAATQPAVQPEQPPNTPAAEPNTAPPNAAEPSLQQPSVPNADPSAVGDPPSADAVEVSPPSALPPPDPPEPEPEPEQVQDPGGAVSQPP